MTHDPTDTQARFDRRTFLVGTAAVGLLAACGGDEEEEFSLIQRYPSDVLVPGELRLPFSLSKDAELIVDGPDTLSAQVVDLDGNKLGEPLTAIRREVTPAPYYSFVTTIDTPGLYGIVVDGGPAEGANFEVREPSAVAIPIPGQAMPSFATPTVGAPAGVDPVCTREPNCDFHALTLTDALATGNPVAYFVGTPAFCATGSCTPALEALVEQQADFSDVVFVHAEVYTDLTATELAPAVQDLALAFEPTLFLIDGDGVIAERLDGLWDTTELAERLQALMA